MSIRNWKSRSVASALALSLSIPFVMSSQAMASPVIDMDDIPSISYHGEEYQGFDNDILDDYSNIDNPVVVDPIDERDESRK